jgi:hypothetical protein
VGGWPLDDTAEPEYTKFNGGCDERSVCTNVSPGRECGPCPPGYFGPYHLPGFTVLDGNTTCIPPYVPPGETTLAPEQSLLVQAPAARPRRGPSVILHSAMCGLYRYSP